MKREKFKNKEYRHAFMVAQIEGAIPYAIRKNREARGWSQGYLAKELGRPQSTVSRIETSYADAMTIKTLLRYAEAFDCALIVKFISYEDFLKDGTDILPPVKPWDEQKP